MIKTTKFKNNSSDVGTNDYISYDDLDYDYQDFRYPNEPARGSSMYYWGWGGKGSVFTSGSHVLTPTLLGPTGWKFIGGFNHHILAVKTNGTLVSWGYNSFGQLGIGTNGGGGDSTNRSSPVQIGSLTNWKYATGGYDFSMAIKTDGTLWSWGYNSFGQLGLGTTGSNNSVNSKSSPNQVGSLTNWRYCECGDSHTVAIKTDGTIWTWGTNGYGQLGQGDTTHRSSPVQVGSATDWAYISSGYFHCAAIKTNGTLWVWGENTYGSIGDGTRTNRWSPVQIGSSNEWRFVASGASVTTAIKEDGTLWSWGYNTDGRVGDGTTSHRSSPVQISSLRSWKKLSYGHATGCAIKSDGTLWVWGYGVEGELGDGSQTSKSTLVKIGSATDWQSVYYPGYNGFAIK
jgi:alpha-tubulin suppressor-like RCC1 family protein